MLRRCPGSTAVGLGYLHGWEWMVNERGYANVVEVPRFFRRAYGGQGSAREAQGKGKGKGRASADDDDVMMDDDADDNGDGDDTCVAVPDDDLPGVYGVLYLLPPEDEAALDQYEGVPGAYEKAVLEVEMVDESTDDDDNDDGEMSTVGEAVQALVYIDRRRVTESKPRTEYVDRMNHAVDEAMAEWELPEWYVDAVIRRYIPPLASRRNGLQKGVVCEMDV
jgi:hypothetical protein